MSAQFDPDWVVKPGETLRDWCDENRLSVRATATACAMKPEHVQGVIDGKRKITTVVACKLQQGTGIPARLWLNLERAYRAGLAAGKIDAAPPSPEQSSDQAASETAPEHGKRQP